MNVRNIADVNSFISDSSQYKGEIFVNVNAGTSFNDVKTFLDNNNLIAFIPAENAIYAQGHKYKSLTDAQISSLSTFAIEIEELQNKLAIVDASNPTDHDSDSVIGTLTYGTGENQITSSNVTQFVTSVLTRIEAGDSAISTELDTINANITAINNKLAGIDGTVKNYVDTEISTLSTTIRDLINQTLAVIVRGDYATRVEAANNDDFIEVELVQTANTDVETNTTTPFIPPYTYRVKSKNTIASKSDLQTLEGTVDTKIITAISNLKDGVPEAFDTLKEIYDWIQAHPGDTIQMATDIETLKQKCAELLGTVTEEYIDTETGETLTRIKKFTSGNLSGQNWATSIQRINEILATVSFAQGVQDNAEANKIDELDFAQQDASTLTGDNTDTSVKFGESTLTDKHAGISVNLTLLEKIKTNTLALAAADAQSKATTALNSAKSYTDDKLSWIVL